MNHSDLNLNYNIKQKTLILINGNKRAREKGY